MKLSRISLMVIAMGLLTSPAWSLTEQEEQNLRKPKPLTQKEAKALLLKLNKEVNGSRAKFSGISSFVTGNSSKKGSSLNEKQEDALVKQHCLADETEYQTIQKSLLKDWITSWKSKDLNKFKNTLSPNIEFSSFTTANKKSKKLDHILLETWAPTKSIKSSKLVSNDIEKYLTSFTEIEDIKLTTKDMHIPMKTRSKDLSLNYAKLEVRFDLRGKANKVRRNDRGYIQVEVSRNNSSREWLVDNVKILKMESLTTSTPSFREITSLSSVKNVHNYKRIEAIRRGGYGLSVGDYNGDGYSDMYVGSYGPGQLFQGSKDGTFKEVKNSGIKPHLYVKAASFADFNNDGHEDLLLIRFVPSKLEKKGSSFKDIVLYQNLGKGKFKEAQVVIGNEQSDYAMPMAVADFDNDGLLDFYVGNPGNKDFSTFDVDLEYKKKLKAQGVYYNQGNFVFKAKKMGKGEENFEKYSEAQQVYPHSSLAADINQDGHMDIVVIDDRGNLSPLYMNDGKGSFYQGNQKFDIENYDYGMGIGSSDVNNDGLTDLFITNVRFAAKERIKRNCLLNWDTKVISYNERNNRKDIKAFLGTKTGNKKSFLEAAKNMGLTELGDGLGGMEFLDYNNDGFEDIYVVNGLWSGTDEFEDIASMFTRAEMGNEKIFTEARLSTQSQYMNILSHFKGDTSGKGDKKTRLSFGGFQRNRLFRNNGDGTFLEVGYLEGVDSIADGYILSKADVNSDGRLDMILRNADPGTDDVNFSPVQVFENINKNKNALRIKLVGVKSNKSAIGASVTVRTKDGSQLRQLIGNLGTSQSEKTIHFGLGDNKVAEMVEVKWPSGAKSTFKNIKPGTHVIAEDNQHKIIKITSK